jgi:hypothetical protein
MVVCKAAIGTALTTVLTWINGKSVPNLFSVAGLFTVGTTGYELSLRFYLLAQSAFGATRTGSVFFAPFIGALLAFAMGDWSSGVSMAAGGSLMLLGVVLHLAETMDMYTPMSYCVTDMHTCQMLTTNTTIEQERRWFEADIRNIQAKSASSTTR